MDGRQRQGLGARLSERLLRRARTRTRLSLADTLLARFGMPADWDGKLLDGPVDGVGVDGMVTLSIQPYLRRLRRLAWSRRRRDARLERLGARFERHTASAALRRLPGTGARKLSAAGFWGGVPGVMSNSEMHLPEPAAAAPVSEEAPVSAEGAAPRPASSAWGARVSASPWLETPWSGARVIRSTGSAASAASSSASAAPRRERAARASALERAGQRAATVGVVQDPLARQIEAAAPVLARTRRGRAVTRELVELVELPPEERAVRIRKLVRRVGAVARPIIEEVEASVPQAKVSPTAVAVGRMPTRDQRGPRRGLRPVMSSSPAMQSVRPSIPVDLADTRAAPSQSPRPVQAAASRSGRRGGAWLSSSPVRRAAVVSAGRALSASPVARSRAAVASVRSAGARSRQHQRTPTAPRRAASTTTRSGANSSAARGSSAAAGGGGRSASDSGGDGPSSAGGEPGPDGSTPYGPAVDSRVRASDPGAAATTPSGDAAGSVTAPTAASASAAAVGTLAPSTAAVTTPDGRPEAVATAAATTAGGDRRPDDATPWSDVNPPVDRSSSTPRPSARLLGGDIQDGALDDVLSRPSRSTAHAFARLSLMQASTGGDGDGIGEVAALDRILQAPARAARVAGAAVVRTPQGLYVPARTLAAPSVAPQAADADPASVTSAPAAWPTRKTPTPGVRATYVDGVPSTATVAARRSPAAHAAERSTPRTRAGSVLPAAVRSPVLASGRGAQQSSSAIAGPRRALRSVRRSDGAFVAARTLQADPAASAVASMAARRSAAARPSAGAPSAAPRAARAVETATTPRPSPRAAGSREAGSRDSATDASAASWALGRLEGARASSPAAPRRSLLPTAVPSLRALRPAALSDGSDVGTHAADAGRDGGGTAHPAAWPTPRSTVSQPRLAGGATRGADAPRATAPATQPTRTTSSGPLSTAVSVPQQGTAPVRTVSIDPSAPPRAQTAATRRRSVPAAVAAAARADKLPVVGQAVRRAMTASPASLVSGPTAARTRHRPSPVAYARAPLFGTPRQVVLQSTDAASPIATTDATVASGLARGSAWSTAASGAGGSTAQVVRQPASARSVDASLAPLLAMLGQRSASSSPLARLDARALSTATWVMDASGASPARFSAAAARRAATSALRGSSQAQWRWTSDGVVLALPPTTGAPAADAPADSGAVASGPRASAWAGSRVTRTPAGTYAPARSASAPPPTWWAGARSARTPGSRLQPSRASVTPRGRFDAAGTYRVPLAAASRGATTSMAAPSGGRVLASASGDEMPETGSPSLGAGIPGSPVAWMSSLGAPAGRPDDSGRGRPRPRPALGSTLGSVEDGVDDPGMPTWARRASGQPLIHREDRFIDALARAEEPEEVVRIIYERAARGGLGSASGLPAPVIKVIEQIRSTAAAIDPDAATVHAGPGSDAEVVRRAGGGRGAPRASARVARGFTSLRPRGTASRRDGVGADKLSKLSRRLQDLILLAERQRGAAREQVRMAEDSAAARAEGQASPGGAEGGSEKKIDIEALGREVLEVVSVELEMRKQRSQEGSDEYGWW